MINIELTTYEADMFKLYQKYHDVFEKLTESHAFDLEWGKVTISFAFGEIQSIEKQEIVYRRPAKS
jgi:hypothetical protein